MSEREEVQHWTAIELPYEVHAFERLLEHETQGRAKEKCAGSRNSMLNTSSPNARRVEVAF